MPRLQQCSPREQSRKKNAYSMHPDSVHTQVNLLPTNQWHPRHVLIQLQLATSSFCDWLGSHALGCRLSSADAVGSPRGNKLTLYASNFLPQSRDQPNPTLFFHLFSPSADESSRACKGQAARPSVATGPPRLSVGRGDDACLRAGARGSSGRLVVLSPNTSEAEAPCTNQSHGRPVRRCEMQA